MHIIPKGILAQYLCMRYEYTEEETIRRMTYIRPVKEWLMAGNPMLLQDCIKKCEKWRNHGLSLEYNYNESERYIEVIMQHVDFRYSCKERNAKVILDAEACRKLGWTQTEYMLNGRYCCNMDRVYTLNERLDNAIELPSILEWYSEKGILQKKKEDYKALCHQLEWWNHILNMYCHASIGFFSTKKMRRMEEMDDSVRIRCYLDGEELDIKQMSTSDTSKLDDCMAKRYLPWLNAKKNELEEHLSYLRKEDISIPEYTKETQPKEFDKYFDKDEIDEDYRPIYNLLYETGTSLGMEDKYDGHYFYFYFNTSEKPCKLLIMLHSRPFPNNIRLNFVFQDSKWKEEFPAFWSEVREKAISLTQQSIEIYQNSIRQIEERLNNIRSHVDNANRLQSDKHYIEND